MHLCVCLSEVHFAFSALTMLDWQQKWHPAYKKLE